MLPGILTAVSDALVSLWFMFSPLLKWCCSLILSPIILSVPPSPPPSPFKLYSHLPYILDPLPQSPGGWDSCHAPSTWIQLLGLTCQPILCLLSIYMVPLCKSNLTFHVMSLLVPSFASTAFSLTCVLPPVIRHIADSKPLCMRLESGLVASHHCCPFRTLCLTCSVWQLPLLLATS